jgi:hypothetical protein
MPIASSGQTHRKTEIFTGGPRALSGRDKPRFTRSRRYRTRLIQRPEMPTLELVLSLARREVLLAPNGLARMRSLQHEAELILALSAAFTR